MKRTAFLSGSAAVLSGCGGGMHAIPGAAISAATGGTSKAGASFTYIPAKADPIPASVLQRPIVGEAARFDGAIAPPMWMLAQGQTLQIKDHAALFRVLGTIVGGDGKTTFVLPKSPVGLIIATDGVTMTGPASLASMGRKLGARDSLGTAAIAAPTRLAVPERAEAIAARSAVTSQTLPSGGGKTTSAYEISRIAAARADAATAAFQKLSPATREVLVATIEQYIAARTSLADFVRTMDRTLSANEATGLLAVSDASSNAVRNEPRSLMHANASLEAARFLVSVAMSPEQMERAIANGAE